MYLNSTFIDYFYHHFEPIQVVMPLYLCTSPAFDHHSINKPVRACPFLLGFIN